MISLMAVAKFLAGFNLGWQIGELIKDASGRRLFEALLAAAIIGFLIAGSIL